MSKWTDHIKQFAKDKGISYKEAMSSPECKSSYGGKGKEPKVEPKVELKVEEIKKPRGRPKKVQEVIIKEKLPHQKFLHKSNPALDQLLEAKSIEKTGLAGAGVEIPKMEEPVKKRRGRPLKVKGEGLIAGYKTEAPNGLGHIYPISHNLILEMVKRGE
jgi:hypothetical protein